MGEMPKLGRNLKEERGLILLQEELLWIQKSHNWLKFGDGNSKFFHTSMLVRIRRNRIEALVDKNRIWVEEKEELMNMALRFYME